MNDKNIERIQGVIRTMLCLLRDMGAITQDDVKHITEELLTALKVKQ